ncbi:MAG: ABC transporter ATP-binding protein [Candidatus Rokubacteria bacterium]|nr:ABC transporter ATP-binding protein [Candidatus Rokubacteria bacterium]MBI2555223.1 ABC transporter ATP-binding protein [Candidatus Rokubacteria bacterium]
MLEVRDLRKEFQPLSGQPVVALGSVSFRVEAGQFVSIVGPSGCGKSTLLQCIAGLSRPTAGRVLLHGREVTGPPEGLILLFQEYNKSLMAWRSVLRNVRFGLENRAGMGRAEMDAEARRYIDLVGLKGFEAHYPWELSGGMQQRVAIARALVRHPEVLLMDEPFGSLDALTRIELEDALLRLWESLRATILFVTHDIEEAVYLSDRVYVLSHRPSQVIEEIEVKLERPRNQLTTREDPRFIGARHHIFELISKEMAKA